jgi:alkylation response protein AidB-like acyl-CoA dehydrogenase
MLALIERAHLLAHSHAQTRRQRGTILAHIPAVSLHLKTIEQAIALARVARQAYECSPRQAWSAMPKLIEAARKAADSAIQVMGGAGYIVGHGVELYWRDVLQLAELFAADPW